MKVLVTLAFLWSFHVLQAQSALIDQRVDSKETVSVGSSHESGQQLLDTMTVQATSFFVNEDSNQYRVLRRAIEKIKQAAAKMDGDFVEISKTKIEPVAYAKTIYLNPNSWYYEQRVNQQLNQPVLTSRPPRQPLDFTSRLNLRTAEGYKCTLTGRVYKTLKSNSPPRGIEDFEHFFNRGKILSVASKSRITKSGLALEQPHDFPDFSIGHWATENGLIYVYLDIRYIPVHKYRVMYFDEKKLMLTYQQGKSKYSILALAH